jgi:formate--tetrahydrofolate ligase
VCSLGGVANGFPRVAGFDITVASEIMAILCLSTSIADLERRIGQIVVAAKRDKGQVFARDLKAPGAMTVLLRDALMPNLVQTLENNPAFVHGGPFANIAHGCNSAMATKAALKLADYVVTEAGFGADLGAEKFFDIKCRKAGLTPAVTVIVATVRALKMHGGLSKEELKTENVAALKKGLANLGRHVENVKKFGVPIAIAVNHFISDTDAEIEAVRSFCKDHGVEAFKCTHWAEGGKGTEALAKHVANLADKETSQFHPIYNDDMPLWDKISTIVREIYRGTDAVADKSVRDQLRGYESQGYGKFPICMAKTQYSFSTDPNLKGAPSNHVVPIREVRLSAGAEFIVVVCGDIMTMPGLPKTPAAEVIGLDQKGQIAGLF